MPEHPVVPNPVFAKYKLVCTYPGCKGAQQIEQAQSAGLRIGDLVPEDPGNFHYARCPRCKRTQMRVVEAPEPPKPKTPVGWTKIPTE